MHNSFGLAPYGDMPISAGRLDHAKYTKLNGTSPEDFGRNTPHMTADQRREWLAALRAELTQYRSAAHFNR